MSPKVLYEVSDKRFGVRFKVEARNPAAAYGKYLRLANKALPPTKRPFVKGLPKPKPFQKMLGHAPTFEGGWLGVSIRLANPPAPKPASDLYCEPFRPSGVYGQSKWHRRMVASGRKAA